MNRYEVHITVDNRHRAYDVRRADWIPERWPGAKVLDIELDSGRSKHQVMLGMNIVAPNFIQAVADIKDLREQVSEKFVISRLKVEGHPDNDKDQSNLLLCDHKPIYWEAHWKLNRGTSMRPECFRMPVLHSFNVEDKNVEYWTIRTNRHTKHGTFLATYRSITEWLTEQNALIKPPHMETALIDTNLKLDEGWVAKHG